MSEPSNTVPDLERPQGPSRSGCARTSSTARFWVGIPALFLTTVVLLLAVWAMILPASMGWKPVAIISGSMYPLIKPGDIVVAAPPNGAQLEPGTVIVFKDPVFDGLISHRIATVNEDGTYTTKGDANASKDSTPISPDAVVGVGRLLVPYIGTIPYWRSTGQTLKLGIAIVAWVALFMASRWGLLERYDPWTLQGAPTAPSQTRGRHRAPQQRSPYLGVTALSVIASITLILGVALSAAALTATTFNTANSFTADSDFSYTSVALADNPSLWWRLGDAPTGGGPGTYTDDFETFGGWTNYGSGTLSQSNGVAHGGSWSGYKDTANDPNGAWKPLGFTTGAAWSVEAWILRPSVYPGKETDRIAVENGSFNGYGVMVNHTNNTFRIERRTGGAAKRIGASVALTAPVDAWYRIVFDGVGGSFTATVFDAGGTPLATVAASDATYTGFDRFVVHGGYDFYVDDVTVTTPSNPGTTTATDTMGVLNGTYVGSPSLGQTTLVAGESDTAAAFNGADQVTIGDSTLLNTSTRSRRSVELWFNAAGVAGRQVLYEEGGSTNGMVIYLDGSTLRARAWSASTGWGNELDTSTAISTGVTYHVVVTLDTNNSPNLTLYLNGVPVAMASKPDANAWSTHSDDGGIAAQNGSTKYHDGTVGTTGTNFFSGTIDDVAVYNTVLPASRVLAHWIAGTP